MAVVTASRGLNVRRNPNTGNVPLRALRMGERVDVYGVENGWAWIKDDRTEWVSAYLSQKDLIMADQPYVKPGDA